MKTKVMILAGCLSLSAHVTAQEQGGWYSWSGPGTQANYSIDVDGGTTLTIVCKDAEPVSMFATIKGKEYGSGERDFKLIVDGNEYLEPPYQLAQFDQFWDQMRQAQTLYITTSRGLTEIPTTGLEVLPASNSPDYSCYTQPNSDEASSHQQTSAGYLTEEEANRVIQAATQEGDIDLDRFAIPATTADMSQTQMGARHLSSTPRRTPGTTVSGLTQRSWRPLPMPRGIPVM
ncbi:hypothetical protein ACVDHJ_16115 [Aeromonas sp. 25-281]|uniref:hypothetical protein n=1 Tax=Aeromonas caviae TaxID=648 RepID=UPI00253FDE56|nr:hypothetical protein [Aeromonas caviae]MDK3165544.1 hypothetical protein [Aeromonas caviae]